MTRTTRFFDAGFWWVVVLALFAALPLWMQAGLPNGSDVLYHSYRAGEMARAWEQGVWTPRWAEGFYFGYGAPMWHYYGSLTYYLTSVLMLGLSFSALNALRLLIVLCFILMATGAYVFMRYQLRQQGAQVARVAGVIAGVVYLYSPYMLYTEPYARGTYPEMLAFALLPWVLWRFGQVLDGEKGGTGILYTALSLFLVLITHNLTALGLVAWMGAWWLWRSVGMLMPYGRRLWTERRQHGARLWGEWRPLSLAFLALLLGVGLATYFWLPVIVESDAVSLQNLTGVALLEFRNFFVPLSELLAFRAVPDLGAINGLYNIYPLGVVNWLAALAGAFCLIFFYKQARWGAFFVVSALFILFLITPASRPIWESFTFLQTLQFPFRLLGQAAFALAVLAGLNALWIVRLAADWAWLPSMALLLGVLVTASSSLRVPEWRHPRLDTSLAAYHAEEVAGRQLGTTFTNEFQPRDVRSLPTSTDFLLADYADGKPVNRLNPATVPEGAQVDVLDSSVQNNVWRVNTPLGFQAEILTFHWLGWRASVDGQEAPITPSSPHGFITFPVLAGEHEIRVWLDVTPIRAISNVISLVLGVVLLALAGLVKSRAQTSPLPLWTPAIGAQQSAWRGVQAGVLSGVALAWVAVQVSGTAWLNTPYGSAPAQVPAHYDFGQDFRIIGYDLNGTHFQAGDTLELTVYWLPIRASELNFSSFVHVAKPLTPPAAQADKLHPAERAIREWWTPTGYLRDDYVIQLPAQMPSAFYELRVGLYTCELMPADACGNGFRPEVRNAEGDLVGDSALLVRLTVGNPSPPFSLRPRQASLPWAS